MTEKSHPPLLLQLLFGEQAQAAAQTAGERLLCWAKAFDQWLLERETHYHPKMKKDCILAWKGFFGFTAKAPWEIDKRDVLAWANSLLDSGRQPTTIRKRLTWLSMFYHYCAEKGVNGGLQSDQADEPLNPYPPNSQKLTLSI